MAAAPKNGVAQGSGLVLAILASGQFLMTLDATVMNVSISQVAKDLGTDVTGIQTAITLYTLVMASLMITGSKVGAIIGRRRAFQIGLVVYGIGSFTTALAPGLPVLMLGWSLLEGIGAALIMPAIVALVAGNFTVERRSAAYGAVAAAGAIAVAVGPLLGGAVTTFASWRWVFLAETVIVFVILLSVRKIEDAAPEARKGFDVVGALLSIVSLCLIVLAALKSGQWGWIRARSGEPGLLGISAVAWMILGGAAIIAAFVAWERRRARREAEPLVNLALFSNRQVVGGLIQFFFQFLAQAGVFFTIPLFLSVVLGLSALQTGLRLLPLSATLLLAAILIPKFLSKASPRRIVQAGLCSMIAGTVVLIAGVSPGANAGVVAIPMVLMGLGIGALASQLGAITVSGASAEDATDVGGLQNTATNLGASFGTALAGAVLIAHLASSTLSGITSNPQASAQLKTAASTQLSQGVAFVSDAELSTSLKASTLSATDQQVIIDANTQGRIDGLDSALTIIACLEVVALGFTRRLPRRPLADSDSAGEAVV